MGRDEWDDSREWWDCRDEDELLSRNRSPYSGLDVFPSIDTNNKSEYWINIYETVDGRQFAGWPIPVALPISRHSCDVGITVIGRWHVKMKWMNR